MKIQAAQRISATKNFDNTKYVLNKLGIDAELTKVEAKGAVFDLKTPTSKAVKTLTSRFGKPSEGRKGDTRILVWDKWHPEICILIEIPKTGTPVLEVYEK